MQKKEVAALEEKQKKQRKRASKEKEREREIERPLPLLEIIKEIFKKIWCDSDIPLAAGVTIRAVISSITNGLKPTAKLWEKVSRILARNLAPCCPG